MDVQKVSHAVTKEQWKQLIIERQESGMTVRDWCLEKGITESNYYYWLKIIRQDLCDAMPSKFVPILQESPAVNLEPNSSEGVVAIINNGNLSISIKNGISSNLLSQLIGILKC